MKPMTATPQGTQCRHATCRCTVEASLAYCCEYCARADQQPATEAHPACECGHPECRRDVHGDRPVFLEKSDE